MSFRMLSKGVPRPLFRVSEYNIRLRLKYLHPRFGDKTKGAPHLLNPVWFFLFSGKKKEPLSER